MNTIVMDTSNNYLAIALYQDGKEIENRQIEALKKQSELAIPYLEEMMDHYGLVMKDMDEMIISIGPGSYTGVRIALTIAKTLAAILPIRIKAISSLAMLAGKQKAITMIDARGKKVYVGRYDQGRLLDEECLMSVDEFEEYKAGYPDYPVITYDDPISICRHLYLLSDLYDYIDDCDALVPKYIKEVEAKKQCL